MVALQIIDAQSRASDPSSSAWVSANAGSGKTHVLVNRIVRLLLTGTDPARILCLTFTRAAAAEMADRLFGELSGWIALSEDEIINRVHAHTGHPIQGGKEVADARQLFARALETPGGLKVQTIHAFCERLLQRFPVEAGMVPGFTVMDEQMARDVLQHATAEVLSEARSGETRVLAEHLATISSYTSPDQFGSLLGDLLSERHTLEDVLRDEHSIAEAIAELAPVLSVSHTDTTAVIEAETRRGFDPADYEALLASSFVPLPARRNVALLLEAKSDREVFEAFRDLFLTSEHVL